MPADKRLKRDKTSLGFLPPVVEVPQGSEETNAFEFPGADTLDAHLPDIVHRSAVPASNASDTSGSRLNSAASSSRDTTSPKSKLRADRYERKQALPQVRKPLSNAGRELLEHLQNDIVDIESVLEMLEDKQVSKEILVNEADEVFGWHSLLFAANKGNLQLLTVLMDAKAAVNAACNLGNTALHLAVRSGRVQASELLLARRADANAANKNGWTAVIWAAINGYQQVVPLLLDAAADVNSADDQGRTACMWATRHRHADILEALLAVGPDLKLRDNDGLSAADHAHQCQELRETLRRVDDANRGLIDAAKQNQPDRVRASLSAGANVNASDNMGNTALGWATANGSVELVKVLMQHGGDVALARASSAHNRSREAAVHAALQEALSINDRFLDAARDDDWSTVAECLKTGAWVEVRDRRTFQTVLIYAGVHGATDAVIDLANARATLERRDIYGWTAMHSAVHYGWPATVSALCYVGANLSSQTFEGDFPLHLSAKSDHWIMLQALCSAHADLNSLNTRGHTPLQAAAICGSPGVLSVLLALRADTTVRDEHDRSVLALAILQGHAAAVEVLLDPVRPPKRAGKRESLLDAGGDQIQEDQEQAHFVEKVEDSSPRSKRGKSRKVRSPSDDRRASAESKASNASKAAMRSDCQTDVEGRHGKTKKASRLSTPSELSEDDRRASTDTSISEHSSCPKKKSRKKAAKKKDTHAVSEYLEPLEEPTSPTWLLARAQRLCDALPKELPAALSAGPALAAADLEGRAALALAVQCRHHQLVTLLLDRKASVDACDVYGITALMLAAAWGEPIVIDNLLQAGAQVNALDQEGKTSIDHACCARVERHLQAHADRLAVNKRLNMSSSMPELGRKSSRLGGGNHTGARTSRKMSFKERPVYRLRLEKLPVRLPMDMIEGQIRNALRGAHSPAHIDVVVDPITQRPRGYAYVDYLDAKKAEAVALRADSGLHDFFGRGVRVVMEAMPELPA